ncbi:MAG: type IV secretion system DNA-binding domain-containing protein [Candidatus Doudnabacteria bacterium]|nr:type IV secretion system DNA-binding domain-containing protein [Candidatus Doudnabacteria bacterium]
MDNQPKITTFAKTNFRGKEVAFGIKTDDRRRHMYLIGKTGMGKTSLMENMVIQDIRNGHGVAFLDPHGDSVQRILNCIPPHRVNDVVYFNPADLEFPVAFNILEAVDAKYKHLVASGLMGVFTKIWANLWSARMEYILNNTVLALLDSPGNTLLGITRMYVDKKYRKKIVDNIKDPVVKSFWVDEFANYNEKYRTEAIAPIQNKVGQFLSSGIIRNIVGQPKSTIDLREVMDNRKILIMDLSKGKVGEDNSALLGAMIVTKLQLAAMSRTDIPESERKDFYLYVDEFQNFATDSFATILSEARKYRLNLIVGHQYIAQLENDKNTKVRDAIFGNVGTIAVFRIGAADAEFLETEFEPIFTPNDLVNLPKYNIVLKLMINGVASEPFSAVTLAPNDAYLTNNSEKVIRVSRERYANPVDAVEEKISRWMGAEFHQESAEMVESEEQEIKVPTPQEEIAPLNNSVVQVTPLTMSMPVEEEPAPAVVEEKQVLKFAEPPREEQSSKFVNFEERKPKEDRPKGYKPSLTFRQDPEFKPKPQKFNREKIFKHRVKEKPQKKENPIWDAVIKEQNQKNQNAHKRLEQSVKSLLSDEKELGQQSSPSSTSTPSGLDGSEKKPDTSVRTILKPNKPVSF